jgi:hypothetical protein
MKETVARFYEKWGQITNVPEQYTVLYLLRARVAAGLENHEEGSEKLALSIKDAWIEASRHLDSLVNDDPRSALKLGIWLCMLPESDDPQVERMIKWIRGDGPVLLAKRKLREPLLDFLENDPNAPEFTGTLRRSICYRLSGLKKEEVFEDPRCFLAVASIYLGTQLAGEKGENARGLFSSAKRRLKDPGVARTVRFYSSSEDTAWIVEALEPFLPKKRKR